MFSKVIVLTEMKIAITFTCHSCRIDLGKYFNYFCPYNGQSFGSKTVLTFILRTFSKKFRQVLDDMSMLT